MIKKPSNVDADNIQTSAGVVKEIATLGAGGTPIPGPAGADGVDGYTPIKGVDYFDGASGTPGVDGYTPIKNVDYFDGLPGTPGADSTVPGPPGPESTVPGPKGDPGTDGAASTIPGPPGADSTVPGPKGDPGEPGAASTVPGPAGEDGADGHSPVVAFGTAGDADRLTIDGTPAGPHLTGPQGTPGVGEQGIQGIQGVPGPSGSDPAYALLANGTTAMAFGTNDVVKVTPTATATFTTTVPAAGRTKTLIILTTGTTSRTITFGTGFKPTGTLATGTTSGRVFVIHFTSDGTNLYESGRTAAMAA